MHEEITTTWSLRSKFAAIVFCLFILSLLLSAGNLYLLSKLRGNVASMRVLSAGRARCYEQLYLAGRIASAAESERPALAASLLASMKAVDQRPVILLRGDPSRGVPANDDPRVLREAEERSAEWQREVRPLLERILSEPPATARTLLPALEKSMASFAMSVQEGEQLFQQVLDERVSRMWSLQFGFVLATLIVMTPVFLISRTITRRIARLSNTARRVAAGEFDRTVPIEGSDEVAELGVSFNTMTARLRNIIETETEGRRHVEELLEAVRETAASLTSATAEILAGTNQQASGAQEQAAAVTETVSTVDEVLQTSEQAAQRAKAVAEVSQQSVEYSKTGRSAVDQAIGSMGSVKEQVEFIAESILGLAEQAQAIGEIISAVNDIAEQTNLLALNAAIEASRAGEHGRGFSVVAAEVKALADQAKKATGKVREILGQIQKATNGAVMATEQGTKSVNETIKVVNQSGDAIRTLAEAITQASQAAIQIAALAGQQVTGMSQIHQAMRDVNQVTTQSLSATHQTERAAEDLNRLGGKLKQLLDQDTQRRDAGR